MKNYSFIIKVISFTFIVWFSRPLIAEELNLDTPIVGLADIIGGEKQFTFTLDEMQDLSIFITAPADVGDADLYVTKDGDNVCLDGLKEDSNEACEIINAAPGTYSITIEAYDNYSDVTLSASIATIDVAELLLTTPITNINGILNDELRYYIDVDTSSDLRVFIADGTGDADIFVYLQGSEVCQGTNGPSSNDFCAISNADIGRYEVVIKAFSDFSGVTLSASTQLLPYQFNCTGTIDNIIIRTTDTFVVDNIQAACDEITATEALFHQTFPNNDTPVPGDLNDTLYLNIFASHEEYSELGRSIFNQNSNSGVYLESDPEGPDHRANFITFNAWDDWSGGENYIWAFAHESLHYFDGRYHKKGKFGAYDGIYSIDWWTEGLAEYLSKHDEFLTIKLALSNSPYTLLDIFSSTYSKGLDPYGWGAIGVQYLTQKQPDAITTLTATMRIGDWAAYDLLLESFANDFQDDFVNWQQGELLTSFIDLAKPLTLADEISITTEFGNLFYVDITEDNENLSVVLTGGSGDLNLYVAKDRLPNPYDADSVDCFSVDDSGSTEETCMLTAIAPGRYYVLLDAPGLAIGVNATLTVSEQIIPEHQFLACQLELPYFDRSNITASIAITNNQNDTIKVYWIDNEDGDVEHMTNITASQTWSASDWVIGDRLVLTHEDDSCIDSARLNALSNTFVVENDDSILEAFENNDESFDGQCPAEQAYDQPQANEAFISLNNQSQDNVLIYSLSHVNGQRSHSAIYEVNSGESLEISQRLVGEKLVFTDENNNCLEVISLEGNDNSIEITAEDIISNSDSHPYSQVCAQEQIYSASDINSVINLTNQKQEDVRIYWLVPETGERYGSAEATLSPGESWKNGYIWRDPDTYFDWYQGEKIVITDKFDNCIGVSSLAEKVNTVTVTDAGLTEINEDINIGDTCASELPYDDVYDVSSAISVTNDRDEIISIQWLSRTGKRGSWMSDLASGDSWDSDDWKLGDRLVITDQYGRCLDAPRLDGLTNDFTVTIQTVEQQSSDIPEGDVGLTCDAEQPYDDRTNVTAAFAMENLSEQSFNVYWLSTSGHRSTFMGAFQPGETFSDDDWVVGDRMVVTDKFDNCLGVAKLASVESLFSVTNEAVLNIDSDNDGIPDEYELANGLVVGIDDSALDADDDNLTNLEEYLAGTDPQNEDTDGDGVIDGDDFAPTNADISEAPATTILLVDDDDNSPNALSKYTQALDELYVGYDVWNTNNSDNEPSIDDLNKYQQVIWFTGDNDSDYTGPSAASELALASYLDTGACLVLSANDYRYIRGNTDFAKEYFGISLIKDIGSVNQVTATGLLAGLSNRFFDLTFGSYTDKVTTNGASSLFIDSDDADNIVGSHYENGVYHSVFLGFGFDAISESADRTAVMAQLIADCATDSEEFDPEAPVENTVPTISGTPTTSVEENTSYSFIPDAVDAEQDTLSFTIINKPLWASFNTQTGEISGTPEQSDIGVTSNITISVSDDELTAQLTDFNIEVTAVGEGVPPIPSSYCSVESNNDWEWIGGVSIGEFSQNSIEKGSGYTDLSGYTFYVKGGSDSNVILVAAGDIGYDRRWLFSIDLNQDDSFSLIAEDGESFYIGDGDGSTDIEGTLNIPQEFIGVTTRLRVNMRTEGGDILPCGEDGDAGYGDIADFTLKILGDAPDITGTPNTSILLGNNYNFTPTSFDIDGNELSFAIENAPLWSIFNTDTGQLSGEPTSDYIGLYENIIITVTDEFGFSSSLPAFNINVLDNMPPVINTPANIVIAASNATGTLASNDAIINYLTSAVALDAVDGLVFVSHNAPELFPLGETTVTFYATDGSGNEATTQSTVTITDQSQPEITLLGNFAMTINYGEVYNEPGFSALDNVDGELTQSVVVTGNVISTLLGLYTLNYNLADSAGNNAAQLTRQITVVDITAPIISVPSNIVIAALNADGTAIIDNEIAAFLASATASDNVDGPLTVIHNATGVLALGINTITFSATDNAGNTATAQTQITIVDQSKPVITLIGNTSITLSLGEDYNELGFTALDNVDGVLTQSVIVTGYVNNDLSGLYTLNYNLTDTAGNYAAQLTRQITVVDITAPIISAPTDIVIAALNAEGTPIIDNEIAAFLTAATASDIVDGPLTVRHNAPDVLALGMHTITFSATDNAGNTTTAQAKITIVDQSKPVISLIGNTSITLSFGELYSELGFTAIDNVDGNLTDTVIVEGTIDSYKIGTYTLTYRVTDATNNISTEVTRQITVQDADAPVVTAPNNIIIAAINADGVSIDVDIINDFLLFATAIDNADSEMKVTNDSPEIFPIGVTVVTFSATDSSSNTGTAQAIVTVSDQSAPIIILEGETSITLSINALYIEPGFSVLDNVDGDLSEAVIIEGIIDHSTVGTYTLTYSVTDAAENMSIEVTRQITVQDATAPVVTAPNNIIIAATDADGASSYINVINDFLLFATANDIVDSEVTVTSDAPETFPLGITEVTFSATDNSGNTGTAQATVTVTDQNSPVIILNGEASITLDIDTLYIEPGFSALDNVDGDLSESVNIEGSIDTTLVGIYTLTYNVSDVASNAATELIREVVVIDFTLIDTDNDGTPDGDDAFPFDDSETSDNDGDDLGDNIDPDDDNDGVLDINDAFPLISLNGLKDSDNDGIPDDCGTNCFNMFSDTDDDNDLIPDIDEIFFGLNPLDASDADADLDGDGLSNLNEFLSGSDLFQDSTPPVIFINDNLIVNASGPLTPVDLSDVSATDLVDGNVMVQASTMGPFTTGSHTIVWQATDIAGNMASVEQVLIVQPYININMPAKAQEGDEVSLDFTLNGKPAFYPVEIPYSVQGSALSPEDHDLVSGIAIIEQGTQTKINFTIVDDGNDEGDEQIVVVLGQPFNAALGEFSEKSLIISEEVVLPALSLIAKQAEQRVRIITNNLGIVTVSAVVENAVDLTDYTLNWHVSNAIVSFSTDINSINFDPSNLTAGLYNVQLDIIHKVDIQKTTSMTLDLVVLSQQPILTAAQDSDNDGIDDITEGLTDSDGDGVADYADALTNRNLLQGHEGSQIEQQQTFILQSTSGTRLTLGQTSLAANNNSAQISTTDISMFGLTSDGSDNNYVFPIGLYDFEVHGLPQAGDSVEVIIALMGAIPENGVYRKFVADNWVDFAEDSKNILASAPGSLGICPAPGHESYQPGLTAGYFCLSLTIEDGGMNDSDAMVNGIVKDPGGIAVYTQPDEIVIQPIEEIKTKTSGGSIFILLLVMLCALRQKRFMQIN